MFRYFLFLAALSACFVAHPAAAAPAAAVPTAAASAAAAPAAAALAAAANPTVTETVKLPAVCASGTQKIRESGFVSIGGIEQWVAINGAHCNNPLLLILHGGPGNTMSPYADTIYTGWEQHFTLVQWDQRGAGKTYGKQPLAADGALSLEQMTADGVQLAQYLTRRFGQKKIILLGGSWGSVLGVHMVKTRPDLFHAWVGVSQMVNHRDNLIASYTRMLERARTAGDSVTVTALDALGMPPWTNPRHFGVLRRAIRKYEAKVTDPAPASWWVPAADYASPQALADYEAGEEYSFLQFIGLKGDGMFSRVDLPHLGMIFAVPVFMVQGEQDLLTTPEVARRYFDGIKAPAKDMLMVPRTGHDPNPALLAAQWRVLNDWVLPLVVAARETGR